MSKEQRHRVINVGGLDVDELLYQQAEKIGEEVFTAFAKNAKDGELPIEPILMSMFINGCLAILDAIDECGLDTLIATMEKENPDLAVNHRWQHGKEIFKNTVITKRQAMFANSPFGNGDVN